MTIVHKIRNYDLEERGKAFWKGYVVEFTKQEFKTLENVERSAIYIHSETKEKITVSYNPEISKWEKLFK
jgi:hypothetical protein